MNDALKSYAVYNLNKLHIEPLPWDESYLFRCWSRTLEGAFYLLIRVIPYN